MKKHPSEQRHVFTKEELDEFESRLPPPETMMARMRLEGWSLVKIAQYMGCTQPSVAFRIKKCYERIALMKKIPISLSAMELHLKHLFQSSADYRTLELYVRNFSMSEIARTHMKSDYKDVRARLFLIFDELEKAKITTSSSRKDDSHPRNYAKRFRELYKMRAKLVRPVVQFQYRINPKDPKDPKDGSEVTPQKNLPTFAS